MNEKQQHAIIISEPDEVESHDADVTFLEWYQPFHEPGNTFSYRWNLDQMKRVNPIVDSAYITITFPRSIVIPSKFPSYSGCTVVRSCQDYQGQRGTT
jgi:hypothetical protein